MPVVDFGSQQYRIICPCHFFPTPYVTLFGSLELQVIVMSSVDCNVEVSASRNACESLLGGKATLGLLWTGRMWRCDNGANAQKKTRTGMANEYCETVDCPERYIPGSECHQMEPSDCIWRSQLKHTNWLQNRNYAPWLRADEQEGPHTNGKDGVIPQAWFTGSECLDRYWKHLWPTARLREAGRNCLTECLLVLQCRICLIYYRYVHSAKVLFRNFSWRLIKPRGAGRHATTCHTASIFGLGKDLASFSATFNLFPSIRINGQRFLTFETSILPDDFFPKWTPLQIH